MKTKRNTATGVFVSLVVFSVSLLIAGIALACLTEYGAGRWFVAFAAVAGGALGAVAAYVLVSRYCRGRRNTIAVFSLMLILLATLILSTAWGRVSYSRFGLTVYGFIPVPVLDITVGSNGGLWFRDKSHSLSLEEVRSLLAPEVQVVVIGTGWHEMVKVDPAVRDIEGVEVHILKTPDAFDLFNRCQSEGKQAVLIAHSTC